jgi:hypothetical protein
MKILVEFTRPGSFLNNDVICIVCAWLQEQPLQRNKQIPQSKETEVCSSLRSGSEEDLCDWWCKWQRWIHWPHSIHFQLHFVLYTHQLGQYVIPQAQITSYPLFCGKTLTFVTLTFTDTNRTTILTPSSTSGVTITLFSVVYDAGLTVLYVMALSLLLV